VQLKYYYSLFLSLSLSLSIRKKLHKHIQHYYYYFEGIAKVEAIAKASEASEQVGNVAILKS
jgi:hypothetical protein